MKWFKHDTTALHDAKIEKLIMKYGIEGYGVYFACIEMIASDISKNNITFELEHDAELLAHKFKIDTIKLEEIMFYCITLGLFGQSDVNGRITCLKLASRIDDSMVKNPEMKKLQDQARLNQEFSVKFIENNDSSEQTRLDKTRLDKKRIKEVVPEREQEIYNYIESKFLSTYQQKIGHKYTEDKRLYGNQLKKLSKAIKDIPNYQQIVDKKLIDMYNMSIKSSYWNLNLYKFCDKFSEIVDNTTKPKASSAVLNIINK